MSTTPLTIYRTLLFGGLLFLACANPSEAAGPARAAFRNLETGYSMLDTGYSDQEKRGEISKDIHEKWNALLQKHVSSSGKVNYKGFIGDKAKLDAYLQTLSENLPVASASRAEKMAFWINAYNAFTIDLITDNYPLSSILKLDGGKTWDVKRITLGGKKYSLNQIENEILRPQFNDARIHFAINCAAKSCPPLLNKAFTARNLERLLDQRARAFINDSKFNTINSGSASVSKIFEWYAADFGDLRHYLNQYATVKLKEQATITFGEYNWDLNE